MLGFSSLLEKQHLSFWKLQIAGWMFYCVMIYVTFLTVVAEGAWLQLLEIKAFRTLLGFILSSILRLFYRRMPTIWSFRRVTFAAILLVLTFASLWTVLEGFFINFQHPDSNFFKDSAKLVKVYLDYTMTLVAWSALYFGVKFWMAWQKEHDQALQAIALAKQSQLEMLRYQLNPHFLFNALNSIRASIDEDYLQAKRLVTEFSEFLRFSLLSGSRENIQLCDEIEAVKNYLAIEKLRFEEKLQIEFNIAPESQSLELPAFLIHPLVENAIKHSIMNSLTPLRLKISTEVQNLKLLIKISNTGQLLDNTCSNKTGVGIKNVQQRLENYFPNRSSFQLYQDGQWVRAVIEISYH
ncbi:MAG: histidine kinase [Blastocatellia bacterium]|nr:histidine kinase [Blastocatellia bacterium]